jgi:hypothetical protein
LKESIYEHLHGKKRDPSWPQETRNLNTSVTQSTFN